MIVGAGWMLLTPNQECMNTEGNSLVRQVFDVCDVANRAGGEGAREDGRGRSTSDTRVVGRHSTVAVP